MIWLSLSSKQDDDVLLRCAIWHFHSNNHIMVMLAFVLKCVFSCQIPQYHITGNTRIHTFRWLITLYKLILLCPQCLSVYVFVWSTISLLFCPKVSNINTKPSDNTAIHIVGTIRVSILPILTTRSHHFRVSFSGRPPVLAISWSTLASKSAKFSEIVAKYLDGVVRW